MTSAASAGPAGPRFAPPGRPVRLGAVSYLNTLPLIEGLGKLRDAQLTLTVPSRLADLLGSGEIDAGLASIIDAQRADLPPLALLPAGMIGCDGPTMTVRLFSSAPIERLGPIHADIDSHTSVVLLKIILKRRYGLSPEIVPLDAEQLAAGGPGAEAVRRWPASMLIIGDKVITASPPAALYPHQLDLGEAWKALTGLPFVYAMWMCRADEAASERTRTIAALLDRQRRHNATRLDWIVAARGPARGWPIEAARQYLGGLLRYDVTPQDRRAVDLFFDLAAEDGFISARRPTLWAG